MVVVVGLVFLSILFLISTTTGFLFLGNRTKSLQEKNDSPLLSIDAPAPSIAPAQVLAPSPAPSIAPAQVLAPSPAPSIALAQVLAPTPALSIAPAPTPALSIAPAPTPAQSLVSSIASPAPALALSPSIEPAPIAPSIAPEVSLQVTETPMQNSPCPIGKVQRGAECYESPPEGYTWTTPGGLLIGKVCPEGTKDSGTTCWYDRGAGTVPKLECPLGKIQKGVECYDPPPQGYDWTTPGGVLIGKVCPDGTKDSSTTCWYDRGAGAAPKLECPSGKIQKGVECYDPPPQGYDWTTPGGLLIGKVCPQGTNDSGTTCWYDRGVGKVPSLNCPSGQVQRGVDCYETPPQGYNWTTPGGLIIGKVCPQGTNDSGTTCWYDRGGGRVPDKLPCNTWDSSWRDDGTSCWEDKKCQTKDNGYYNYSWGSIRCTNGKPFRASGYSDCYKTWISKLQITCSGCGCIKKTIVDRQVCKSDEEMIQGLCYKKPQLGFSCVLTNCSFSKENKNGTRKGLAAQQCGNGLQLENGLCYAPPRASYNCTGTVCSLSKEIRTGTKAGLTEQKCDDGKQLESDMCYTPAQPGFTCQATVCDFSKDVRRGNKVDTLNQICDAGKVVDTGLCYIPPKEGFNCNSTVCDFSKDVKPGKRYDLINKS